ncbi:amino acid aldolase [Mangrovibacter sp. MFB070]|uniref:alanine racemase n=1 Tax=Mangrovibacter sp. MFB070 TaxID=1224318 RepID=UPI0004D8CBC0|nr:alanine racemase [Mangrovibacter sp. MFB070]KEA53557.1 amino acid aldolase [Mangrovibacter sp. MFB070]
MKPFPDPQSCDQKTFTAHIQRMRNTPVGIHCKGIPADYTGITGKIGDAGYYLGDHRLPVPLAILRDDIMQENRKWMREYLAATGISLAPHGKTTLAPELFQMQLEDGIWGITAATAQQVVFFVQLGFRRILLANQLVGEGNIQMVLSALQLHPAVQLWVIVDSQDNVDQLVAACTQRELPAPLRLLVELGVTGGRTGLRQVEDALYLARYIRRQPGVHFSGIEGYEGIVSGHDQDARESAVKSMVTGMLDCATACDAEALWESDELILTAGGTEFFDLCSALKQFHSRHPVRVVIRSGCYITSDSIAYKRAFQRLVQRTPQAHDLAANVPEGALEVWAALQSRPEKNLGFATLGKRDISHDWELPAPLYWLRPGEMRVPQPLSDGHRVTKLNDQHAYLHIPDNSPLQIGDLIGFGISHACTTFDKWRCLLQVNAQYQVTGAISTFF